MSSRRGKQQHEISGRYALRTIAMLDSPAYRVLSVSAHRALSRLEIEYRGTNNGQLIVTFNDFQAYGIDRQAIAPAIRELVGLGFVEITERGRGGNVACTRSPTKYRLTMRRAHNDAKPTDEWKKINCLKEAKRIAAKTRAAKNKCRVGKATPAPEWKTHPENPVLPGWKTTPHSRLPRVENPPHFLESPRREHTGDGADATSPAPPASPGLSARGGLLPSQTSRADLETMFAARRERTANSRVAE